MPEKGKYTLYILLKEKSERRKEKAERRKQKGEIRNLQVSDL